MASASEELIHTSVRLIPSGTRWSYSHMNSHSVTTLGFSRPVKGFCCLTLISMNNGETFLWFTVWAIQKLQQCYIPVTSKTQQLARLRRNTYQCLLQKQTKQPPWKTRLDYYRTVQISHGQKGHFHLDKSHKLKSCFPSMIYSKCFSKTAKTYSNVTVAPKGIHRNQQCGSIL